jgi:chromate transporter
MGESKALEKPAATLTSLTEVYLRIGNTTFGGGLPTMAALQRELIDRKKWLTQDDYALAYSLARITPGTNVLAFCAGTAARILGIKGAIAAVVAVTLPSAALAVVLTFEYEKWRTNMTVMAAVAATVAAVAGMMWSSVWLLIKPHVGGLTRNLHTLLFAGGGFAAAYFFNVTPVPIIVASALAGFFWTERDAA